MPMRAKPVGTLHTNGSLNTTSKGSLTLHRQIRWGKHLNLITADVRQHRHADGSTMLGSAQRQQLVSWVTGSTATWTALANGVPMEWFKGAGGAGWGGFNTDREALTTAFAGRRTWNNVVLAGDIHCGIVNGVRRHKSTDSRYVATEFVSPPLTSGGHGGWADLIDNDTASDGHVTVGRQAYIESGSPLHGYLQCNVTGAAWRSEFFLGSNVTSPDGAVTSHGTWKVTAGRVGAHKV
jgi:alkaline phosphatase D